MTPDSAGDGQQDRITSSAAPKMRAVIVVELPSTTVEEFAWACDQIGRAATENWPIERRMHGSLDEAVIEHVLREFYDQGDDL